MLLELILGLMSDFYRMTAVIVDWRSALRIFFGKARYDVACITNLEHDTHKAFLGLFKKSRSIRYGLRFSLKGKLCRYILINSSAQDLMRSQSRELGKNYARIAIATAVEDGAEIILFAAATKRLFSAEELAEIERDYPNIVFSIGDNGTIVALLSEISGSIERFGLGRDARIMILGPNGFLGSTVQNFLQANGFNDLVLVSSRQDNPFAGVRDIRLVIACSHHTRLRLTAEIVEKIRSEQGMHVIDVCRPDNFSKKEFGKCGMLVSRQDAGIVYNSSIKYVFSLGAAVILKKLRISKYRLYGCFGEATALATMRHEELTGCNFLSVNRGASDIVAKAFVVAGFKISPPHNFGEPI